MMKPGQMRRGEVWWVDFDPIIGSEVAKRRPAVIISNDASNATQSRVQVIPFTSSVSRVFPWEVAVLLNGRPSKACADQIKTVSKLRVENRLGHLTSAEISEIERAIRFQLSL